MKKLFAVLLLMALLISSVSALAVGCWKPVPAPASTATVKTATGQNLVVRGSASLSGKKIGYVKQGSQVAVLGTSGKFTKIAFTYKGKASTGYVWSECLVGGRSSCVPCTPCFPCHPHYPWPVYEPTAR